ncbi:MAG: type II toxin-antitoxin system RelE/ParE family toxin [Candidatus Saganbacteria bacterium]|nr:type II toxin-antitoxin system RelE/ParE family toxin [Candidatus Saganbacteria bacterium]
MKYHIEITSSAEKALRKFPEKFQEHLTTKIFNLGNHPRPFRCKKLRGSGYYRIRIGDYRVVYSINDLKKMVKILDIGHRKDIYR